MIPRLAVAWLGLAAFACGDSKPAPAPAPAARHGAAPSDAAPVTPVLLKPPRPAAFPLHHDPDLERALDGDIAKASPDLFAAQPPPIPDRWRTLLTVLQRANRAHKHDPYPYQSAGYNELVALDQALIAANVGYQLLHDSDAIDTYRVDRVATYFAGGNRYTVLEIHRIHATHPTPLGEQFGGPSLMFMDNVDFTAGELAPLVFDGGEYLYGSPEWQENPASSAVARAFTEAVSAELAPLVGGDREAALPILADLVAMSAGRHEVQHMVDARGEALTPIKALESLPPKDYIQPELSAYISQIANDPLTPHFAYEYVMRSAWAERSTYPAYVGVVMTEGLARQLGIPQAGPVYHDDKIDLDRLAPLATAVVARTGPELRAAATTLYAELFGRPLLPITDAL